MKVGSLVVCVDDTNQFEWLKVKLVKGRIYTIEGFSQTDALFLEEHNEKHAYFSHLRVPHKVQRFRELDTPQSISIEEILEEPVYA